MLVEAFIAALGRAGWHQPDLAAPQPADRVAEQDHDDPAATPLQVIEDR